MVINLKNHFAKKRDKEGTKTHSKWFIKARGVALHLDKERCVLALATLYLYNPRPSTCKHQSYISSFTNFFLPSSEIYLQYPERSLKAYSSPSANKAKSRLLEMAVSVPRFNPTHNPFIFIPL